MRRTVYGWIAAAAVVTSVVAGCGGGGGDASSFVLPDLPGSNEYYQTVKLAIPSLLSTQSLLITSTTGGTSEYDTTTRDITVQPPLGSGGSVIASPTASATPLDKSDRCGMYPTVKRFDTNFAASAEKLNAKQLNPKDTTGMNIDGQRVGYVCEIVNPVIGDPKKTVKVMKILDDTATVHCNILVEVERDEDTGAYTNITSVNEAAAKVIAHVFDYENPFDPDDPWKIGIYDRLTNLVGHEWRLNPVGGRDGDQKVNLVLLTENTMGTGLLGLVAFEDSFPKSVAPISNEGEIIYLNATQLWSDASIEPEYQATFFGTLSHEFTHVIQMNTKIAQDGTFKNFNYASSDNLNLRAYQKWERRTLGEGFAETAATVCGYGVHGASDSSQYGGAEVFALDAINKYLGHESICYPGYYGVTTFPTGLYEPFLDYTNSDPYGMGHLFGLYILKHYGVEKWAALTSSAYVGNENLEETLGVEVTDLLHNYHMAITCAGLTDVPDKYTFPYITFGHDNIYYRLFGGNGNPLAFVLNGVKPSVSQYLGDGGISETEIAPWSPRLYEYVAGNNGDIPIEVRLPKDGHVNAVRVEGNKFVEEF